MRKISVSDISKLEDEGWKVKASDKSAIKGQLAVKQAAVAIGVSLENIKNAIEKVELNNDNEALKQLISKLNVKPERVCEFDVKRDKNGFIDKVIVTELPGKTI